MTQTPHVIDRRGCIWKWLRLVPKDFLLQQRYVTLKRYPKAFFSLRQSSFRFLSTCSPQSPFSLSVFYLLFWPHFSFTASIFHSDPVSVFGLTNNLALYLSTVTNIFHPFFCLSGFTFSPSLHHPLSSSVYLSGLTVPATCPPPFHNSHWSALYLYLYVFEPRYTFFLTLPTCFFLLF